MSPLWDSFPLIIILITASLSSNTYKQSFLIRKLDVWGNTIYIIQNVDHSLRSLVWPMIFVTVYNGLSPFDQDTDLIYRNNCASPPFNRGSELCFPELKQSERESRPISIQRPKRWFLILLSFAKLKFRFLHIQFIGTNVWLPETHNVPPEVDFESSRSPGTSESWHSPSLHCFAVLPTIALLFVFTCVMNVKYQSIQAFVTGHGPFCYGSCELFHWP